MRIDNNYFIKIIIMNEKCLIIGHLSLNDLFIINGIINYYTTLYNKVYFLCKKKDYKSMLNCFLNNNLVIPIYIDIDSNVLPLDHKILKNNNNCDIIKMGIHNENWHSLKSDFIIGNYPYLYFKTFYEQLNLDYEIRYNYEKIYRDTFREKKFYNKIMEKYNNQYIFLYGIKENDVLSDIPIFNPYKNYYNKYSKFYDHWKGEISDNIFDYCKIIENSYEIHISFSDFLGLSIFLDLSNVKSKYLYTDITNIKDLHKNLNNWNIMYYTNLEN